MNQPSASSDPFRRGFMHARAVPVIMGSGINAFRYAGSNQMIVQTRPNQDFQKTENWQYSRR